MIPIDSSWLGLPHAPNIMAPRQKPLTCTPVCPSGRSSIVVLPARGGRTATTILWEAVAAAGLASCVSCRAARDVGVGREPVAQRDQQRAQLLAPLVVQGGEQRVLGL